MTDTQDQPRSELLHSEPSLESLTARRTSGAKPPSVKLSFVRWSLAALFFSVAAVALTWPLGADLDDGISLGTESVATVPLFNLWTLAWNVESVSRGLNGYWQAPIFYPAVDAFAFSEPQPVLGLIAAALCALGSSLVSAYAVLLIASLATNGLLTTVLLRRVGLGWLPSLTGGALVVVLPFTHQQLGVLQLVPLAGVLCFALAALRFADKPGLPTGVALGGSLALAYGLSAQIAVFCALVAIPAACWLWWPLRRSRRAWIGVAVGAVVFLGLISPVLVVQLRSTSGEGFVRSAETIQRHSAKPAQYLKTPWSQLIPTPGIVTAERASDRAFWPGTVRVLLALLALVAAWRSNRWRRLAVAGLLVLATSVLLSLGANLGAPLDLLRKLPGLGQIRSFFRLALFAQLAVAVLSAGALHWLLEESRRRLSSGSRLNEALCIAPVAVLALLAVVEMRPSPASIEPLPPLDMKLDWLTWIEEQTEPDDVLAFLPFPRGRSVQDYAGTSQWMYWQQRHWRRMVNGYSGFFPGRFKEIKEAMTSFPSARSLVALRDASVRYCIVPRSVIEASPAPDPQAPVTLELVFRDEQHDLAVFALHERESSVNAPAGQPPG